MISNYWWSGSGNARSCHWIKKSELLKSKEIGGLQFRDLKATNLAALARQCWRIFTRPDSLLGATLRAKYFRNGNIWNAVLGYRPTQTWRGLLKGLEVIRQSGVVLDAVQINQSEHLNDDKFSMRIAYDTAFAMIHGDKRHHPESSSKHSSKKFWISIWKCNLPRKIKLFIWRTFHNGIPTGQNLAKRGMTDKPYCCLCGFHLENDCHVFLQCWWSRSFWASLGLHHLNLSESWKCLADWLFHCHSSCSNKDFISIICGCWFIWYNRNLRNHKEQDWSPSNAALKVQSLVNFYSSIKFVSSTTDHSRDLECIPPPNGFLKINSDASFLKSSKQASIGVIARDSEGLIWLANEGKINSVSSSLDAEGTALKEAMVLAQKNSWDRVIFEVDCANLASLTLSFTMNEWKKDWLRSIWDYLLKNKNWSVILINREANGLADRLSSNALHFNQSWSKLDSIPLFMSGWSNS